MDVFHVCMCVYTEKKILGNLWDAFSNEFFEIFSFYHIFKHNNNNKIFNNNYKHFKTAYFSLVESIKY